MGRGGDGLPETRQMAYDGTVREGAVMFFFSEWNWISVLARIASALLLGTVIGLDRSAKRRVAGVKTNAVVCLGAALVMLTAQYITLAYPGESDVTRFGAQVISGVGFLGVGTIIVSGHKVRGLTTAASLWTCACIGLAAGAGFLAGAYLVTACMLAALHLLPKLEAIAFRHSRYLCLLVEFQDGKSLDGFLSYLSDRGILVESIDLLSDRKRDRPIIVEIVLKLPRPAGDGRSWVEEFHEISGVESIEIF